MNNQLSKAAGIALIAGSVLIVFTMALHPAGGNFEHLLNISSLIIVTHSIAIVSIPVSLFGYWGLTKRLHDDIIFSTAAFIAISFASFAGVCAAAINGLVLPFFVNHMAGSPAETIEAIRPMLLYNTELNHAFDFIFIGATCAAILLWSIAILKTKEFPKWIAWLGIFLATASVVMLFSGFVFVSLQGFRIFIGGIVCWILVIGYLLMKTKAMDDKHQAIDNRR